MVPETRYVKVGDSQVAYQVIGDGPRDVLAPAVFAGHIDGRWEIPQIARFYRRLGALGRLIIFDCRGTGASDPLPGGAAATWEDWLADMGAVLDVAGSQRAVVYSGSFSGPVSMVYAATHPERTESLILFNTTARLRVAPDFEFGVADEVVEALVCDVEDRWGTQAAAVAPGMQNDEAFMRAMSRYQRLAMSPRAAANQLRLVLTMDVRAILPSIRVPTLVLHRREAPILNVEHGRYLAEHIPGARYVELPGRDLVIMTDEAEPALEEIEAFVTGTRRHEPDRVLATVLFTDIVGSTEQAQRLGDRRWRELMIDQSAVVRDELEAARGRLVKDTGDGMLATFDGPARAIRCAGSIRDRLGGLGISLRCGLHTGEVELDGEDVRGIAVHIASRVMARAGTGDVVVSSTVHDLVAGSGIEFEDRGSSRLRGVGEPWRLFAARL